MQQERRRPGPRQSWNEEGARRGGNPIRECHPRPTSEASYHAPYDYCTVKYCAGGRRARVRPARRTRIRGTARHRCWENGRLPRIAPGYQALPSKGSQGTKNEIPVLDDFRLGAKGDGLDVSKTVKAFRTPAARLDQRPESSAADYARSWKRRRRAAAASGQEVKSPAARNRTHRLHGCDYMEDGTRAELPHSTR